MLRAKGFTVYRIGDFVLLEVASLVYLEKTAAGRLHIYPPH
jgi:hypothetical protein